MTKQAIGAGAEQVRALALAYPEAVEEFPWGHTAVKVRGKAFLFMGGEGGTLTLSMKLPSSHGAALLLPFASPTGYGLGKSGWVTASFPVDAPLPSALLAEWLEESYRAVAPKKLSAAVSPGGPKGMSGGTGSKGPGRKGMAEGAGSASATKGPAKPGTGARTGAKQAAEAGAEKKAKAAGAEEAGAGKKAAKAAGAEEAGAEKKAAKAAGAEKAAKAKTNKKAAKAGSAKKAAKAAGAKKPARAAGAKKPAKRGG
ncbi:Predicted DNA-binding protein, MmcQ/YjbR family [Nannocystis exedens]|uniref:Predicted DNA-binding protein, MmcQ/YjbR family n=1 Tax=Nannocystis exedens TaxID=54 RepID=A0A1I1Y359_9BACT|nr:MmcQ/YjbR family DNA-binding protein [Nannocystis exedens]PCC71781.1 difB protein [Nannocystis exedens]SFE13994.1 Predicted DNA-binding protein, MmcQ/YjbR family [Nannocystis exedens]